MSIRKWQIAGGLFTIILGVLLHFTYEWSGEKAWVGVFSAVSESTWEHLKLIFVPMLLFSFVEWFGYGKYEPGFLAIRAFSILIGMAAIVISFYTYTGILGQNFMVADIATFFIGVLAAYFWSGRMLEMGNFTSRSAALIGVMLIALLAIAFVAFTFSPPEFGMFVSPV